MKKQLFLLILALVLVFGLSGCSNQAELAAPINSGGGVFDWILVKPIAYVLNFFADGLGNSFALGVLFATIVVRTIAWPIYAKSNDFSMKMQMMQPELNRLQAKYAGRKDPDSQQKMQAEQMKVWKKYGVSPLGCVVPFLQMPIFIAMYQVVRRYPIPVSADGTINSVFRIVRDGLLNNNLFGLDMTRGIDMSNFASVFSLSTLGYWIIPLLVGGTMYALQKISQKKPEYTKNIPTALPNAQAEQMQKTMKYFMYAMIIMMVFMSMSSTALAFYWLVGNIYSIGQNLVNRKLGNKKFLKIQDQSNIIG